MKTTPTTLMPVAAPPARSLFQPRAPRFAGGRPRRPARWCLALAAVACTLGWLATPAAATPQFARNYQVSCVACHTVVPMVNKTGLDFEALGYRSPDEVIEDRRQNTLPVAVWLTGRHEKNFSRGFNHTYVPKAELISGGPIGEDLAYFLEWRVVSLETRADGSLRDRSGRIEDAILSWDINDRFSLDIGQYRSLNQVDVSRRLSISEPSLFSASLAGAPDPDPRVQSLRGFAAGTRSPGVTLGWHSIQHSAPADGLFHFAKLVFPGEFSIPLTREARTEASFEFDSSPKGVFLETFYRRGYQSIGAHAFLDNDRWLLTGVGTAKVKAGPADLHLMGGLGVDDRRGSDPRLRSTLQAKYLLPHEALPRDIGRRIQPGFGMRFEHVTRTGNDPAWIPYVAISGPAGPTTFLLQLQYRAQPGNSAFVVDLSWLF